MTADHEEQIGKIRVEMREFQDEVMRKIDLLKDNHFAHMQASLNTFQIDFVQVKNDVSWLKSFFWVVVVATVGNIIVSILEH